MEFSLFTHFFNKSISSLSILKKPDFAMLKKSGGMVFLLFHVKV